MDVIIRAMQEQDLPAATRVHNDHAVGTPSSYTVSHSQVSDRRTWWRNLVDDGRPVLVAEVDGLFGGYATYHHFRDGEGYDVTAEVSIWLDTPARGRGVGRKLMTELMRQARRDGLHSLVSVIDSDNVGSLGFHSAMGFTEVGRLPHIAHKMDSWRTAIIMQFVLGGSASPSTVTGPGGQPTLTMMAPPVESAPSACIRTQPIWDSRGR